MLIYAVDTLKQRFLQDAVADYQYRNEYNVESVYMARDHFFGVGIGNYSAFSWHKYAEMVDERMFPGTPAHNFIFLNLAELGYIGCIAIVLIFLRFFMICYLYLKQQALSLAERSYVLAIFLGFLAMLLQEFLNFSYRQMPVLFTFMIFSAAVVAMRDLAKEGKNPLEEPAVKEAE